MAETINMPKLGFDMAEGLLVRWVKQVGENINKGDVLAEIETDKATVEVESSASGIVLQLIVDQGTMVPVNAPIAVVGQAGEKVDAPAAAASKVESGKPEGKTEAEPTPQPQPVAAAAQQTSTPPTAVSSPVEVTGPVKASPLAKKIAKDNNVNLASLQGTGPGGRVVRKDVESALATGQTSKISSLQSPVSSTPVIVSLDDKVVPTTKLRQAIGRRLSQYQPLCHLWRRHR